MRQHIHAIKFYPQKLQPQEVVELKQYLAGLRDAVHARAIFDRVAFDRRIDRVWDDLAYQLPRFGRKTMWAYLRCDHRPAFAKFRYLLSSLLKGKVYRPSFGQD